MKIKRTCPKCKAVHYSENIEYCVCGGKLRTFADSFYGADSSPDISSIFNEMFSKKKKGE